MHAAEAHLRTNNLHSFSRPYNYVTGAHTHTHNHTHKSLSLTHSLSLPLSLSLSHTHTFTKVLGHFKIATTLALGFIFFGAPLVPKNFTGTVLAFAGVALYSYVQV